MVPEDQKPYSIPGSGRENGIYLKAFLCGQDLGRLGGVWTIKAWPEQRLFAMGFWVWLLCLSPPSPVLPSCSSSPPFTPNARSSAAEGLLQGCSQAEKQL